MRELGHMLRAARAEVQTYGWRFLLAEALRGAADRLDPETRCKREERDEVLRELGWWVYEGRAWTCARVMLKMALRRAKTDESWQGAMW
jgi:hypothetical protein